MEAADPKIIEMPFVENSYMEKLIEIAERDPKTFNTLSPATKLSVGYYSAARRKAEMEREARKG